MDCSTILFRCGANIRHIFFASLCNFYFCGSALRYTLILLYLHCGTRSSAETQICWVSTPGISCSVFSFSINMLKLKNVSGINLCKWENQRKHERQSQSVDKTKVKSIFIRLFLFIIFKTYYCTVFQRFLFIYFLLFNRNHKLLLKKTQQMLARGISLQFSCTLLNVVDTVHR